MGLKVLTTYVLFVTGDQRCFLFSLRPVMKIYPTLPHNDHFLYLNANQKALPNGLVSFQLLVVN